MLDKAGKQAEAPVKAGEALGYMPGFGNDFETESLPGALPQGQNSPQKCAYGLYAEQLSGSPFTAPRGTNERSWLYRIRPSVRHTGRFSKIDYPHWKTAPHVAEHSLALGQLRWNPLPVPTEKLNFLEGIRTMTTAGDAPTQTGMAAHAYAFNADMVDDYFFNADGELLIVPESGSIQVFTELGKMDVEPSEICIVPRGTMFKVTRLGDEKVWRGYICENYGALFKLPDLGVIGSNGLANPRDFLSPVASYEDREGDFELVAKFQGNLWRAAIGHSPLDVVAWHGNYAPYKYDLRRFNTIGSISFDHPDPSIFLVLQSPSDTPGVDTIDFVIFGPRWLAMQDSFRPPWFHRNIASEFMGLITGVYDAKAEGFAPGGASLHNCMSGHGPDAETFEKASAADTSTPHHIENTMAFMFETPGVIRPTPYAAQSASLQQEYYTCWQGLKKHFNPNVR